MSNHSWHGYISIKRFGALFPKAAWITLIESIRLAEVNGAAAHYLLRERGNLDLFDEETSAPYSNGYIYEARFAAGLVNFKTFKNEMVVLFEVDPADVTYTTHTEVIRDNPSVFARYYYQDTQRMEIILFGCEDDENLCEWEQSRVECNGYIQDDGVWEEEIL